MLTIWNILNSTALGKYKLINSTKLCLLNSRIGIKLHYHHSKDDLHLGSWNVKHQRSFLNYTKPDDHQLSLPGYPYTLIDSLLWFFPFKLYLQAELEFLATVLWLSCSLGDQLQQLYWQQGKLALKTYKNGACYLCNIITQSKLSAVAITRAIAAKTTSINKSNWNNISHAHSKKKSNRCWSRLLGPYPYHHHWQT